MPRPRLPWFKVWTGATRHAKVSALNDRQFRIWVELMDAAAEQKQRGRFVSCAAAAAVIRRKEAEVRQLIGAGLVDESEAGICMHDWDDWQRWRPEDDPTNDAATTPESHTNNTGKPQESPGNDSNKPVRAREDVDVDVEGDVEREEDREKDVAPSLRSGGPRRRVTVVDEAFREQLIATYREAFGSRQAVVDVMDHAMSHKARLKCTDQRAYLRNWVRDDAEKAVRRRNGARADLRVVTPREVQPLKPDDPRECRVRLQDKPWPHACLDPECEWFSEAEASAR